MPSKQERLDRTLETAYNDCGAKAAHFAAEKNRLESVFATLSVPAIISLGSLWADSDDIVFKLVAVFATGFFFAYALMIGWDLAAADNLRLLAIKSYKHLDTLDWTKKDERVEELLPSGSSERGNYEKLYERLGVDFYSSWRRKLLIALGAGAVISAGYGLALGTSPLVSNNTMGSAANMSRTLDGNSAGATLEGDPDGGASVASTNQGQAPTDALESENSSINQGAVQPERRPSRPCSGVHC